jgi:putative hydrolase of the HAD superfamily
VTVEGPRHFQAVVFDLGGVVLDSPLHEIARFEREHRLPGGLINGTVARNGATGAWARHERGELASGAFPEVFAAEFRSAGYEVDTVSLMERIDASITLRPSMVAAIRRIRAGGVKVAAITTTWEPLGGTPIAAEFDVFVESVAEGVRKPEVEIYLRCLERLDAPAERCVMLDDLGPNLKTARDLGMYTIKVVDPDQALGDLARVMG